MRGSWGVAGTDPEHVERMVQDVTGMLAGDVPRGMGGWLGLAGKLLSGALAPGAIAADDVEHDHRRDGPSGGSSSGHRTRAREERGMVGYGDGGSENSRDERGKGRRRVDEYSYDVDEEEGYYDEDREEARRRRRRRRRRREADEW